MIDVIVNVALESRFPRPASTLSRSARDPLIGSAAEATARLSDRDEVCVVRRQQARLRWQLGDSLHLAGARDAVRHLVLPLLRKDCTWGCADVMLQLGVAKRNSLQRRH